MKVIIHLLKRLSRLFRVIISINWLQAWKLYHTNSEILLWIPKVSPKYFGTDAFIWDMATIAGLISAHKKFSIVTGFGIGKYHQKKIFYTLSKNYNRFKWDDYIITLIHITRQLELQENQIFPKAAETVLWENKVYMHEAFKKAKVNEPETKIFNSLEELMNTKVGFPFLIKAEHSCASEGLYKISSIADLDQLLADQQFMRQNKQIIMQELINMRKDLRVILVGEEIVLHYWRINPDKEWKPTSTSYGSKIDFDFFPEQWRQDILATFKSLNITTGAFDITWRNDDLATLPIYLEVSPFYQPNPKMDTSTHPYVHYKKGFSFYNSWDSRYVDLVFSIKKKQVDSYLNISADIEKTNQLNFILE